MDLADRPVIVRLWVVERVESVLVKDRLVLEVPYLIVPVVGWSVVQVMVAVVPLLEETEKEVILGVADGMGAGSTW